ncbi:M24 family metallopeptidase [Pseudomonas frederiksbergensis]|uniref:M24 family metallopeptidase n=1 Tax=Pseudomonas frederiksbergensis TaxID=104087 RepID=UPI000F48D701|nr:M24 family metallopeptidase [Pseudomonas frederiksbergensis]
MPIPLSLPVQTAAKAVLQLLVEHITPTSTEASIAWFAAHALAQSGYPETWYYACPAFVLLGSRSLLSVSGRDYRPSNEAVGSHNLITVDLSPKSGNVWGDCARSFYVEEGVCRAVPIGDEFGRGHEVEHRLHEMMCRFARPETTFHELYEFANDSIISAGFENLDFSGNVGHSICVRRDDRLYVESGNHRSLGEVQCFTFEPHVRQKSGAWGFKHENIYFFDDDGGVCEL